MIRALRLDDFSVEPDAGLPLAATAPPEPVAPAPDPLPEADLHGESLDAFEQGYRSGWDDCIANETEERRRVAADLAKALKEISATAEQIRAELLRDLSPLFEQIVAQLLPALEAEALAPVLREELVRIAASRMATDLRIVAAPASRPVIEHLLSEVELPDTEIVTEPAYAEGQVSLRFAGQRRDVDLSEAVRQMSETMRAFAAGSAAEDGWEERGVA
jgi:flagellar assembly protein FliH